MSSIYFALLSEVESRGFSALLPGERISLPKKKKITVALSALGQNLLLGLVPDRLSALFRPAAA